MKGKIFYVAILIFLILSLNDIFPQNNFKKGVLDIGLYLIQFSVFFLSQTISQNIIASNCNPRHQNIIGSGGSYNYLLADADEESDKTSDRFSHQPNYSNSFDPSTVFKNTVTKTEVGYNSADIPSLRLSLYDMVGREVAILVDSGQKPCGYKIMWNSINISRRIYFYEVSAKGSDNTKKLLLLK